MRDGKGARAYDRSPAEGGGEKLHMPEHPQKSVLRDGHVPGVFNTPW